MPEETNSDSPSPATKEAKPRVRRISSKPRQKAEEKKEPVEATEPPAPEMKPEIGTAAEDTGLSPESGRQPETKRPNRRRRGKGKGQGQGRDSDNEPKDEESPTEHGAPSSGVVEKREQKDNQSAQGSSPNAQRPQHQPRRKVDPDKVAKNAWKIFLAEVSEEGVALIGDNDARELARRCFRLSEIFLEEEDRRN